MKQKMYRFCSNCGSTDLVRAYLGMFENASMHTVFKCRQCGFAGMPFEGTEEFIRKFKQSISKKKACERKKPKKQTKKKKRVA